MLDRKLLQKKLDATTVRGGSITTAAALLVGYVTRNVDLLPPAWVIIVFALLVAWTMIAIIARLIVAKDAGDELNDSSLLWQWIGVGLAIFYAMPILFLCWLISLPIGSPWSVVTGRALVLLLLVSVLIGMIGQAAINSALVLRHIRRQ